MSKKEEEFCGGKKGAGALYHHTYLGVLQEKKKKVPG